MLKQTIGVALIAALVIGLVPPPIAEGQSRCSRADQLELRRRGASWDEIDEFCSAPRQQGVVTFKRASGWEAFGGRAEDGSKVCGVSTSGGGRYLSMKYFAGDSYLTIQLSKNTWRVGSGKGIDVNLQFDRHNAWTARATSFHMANGDAALQFTIRNENVRQWIQEFRDADVLYIRFPASAVEGWQANLSGTPEIADAMVQCLALMLRGSQQS